MMKKIETITTKKDKWSRIILISILLLGAWIRLYKSTEFFPFWSEQVDDLLAIRMIWQTVQSGQFDQLSLKGQVGTYRWSLVGPNESNPIYHGVIYYYILLPAAVISHFDPYGVVIFLIILGISEVYLLYLVGRMLFADQTIGIIAALLGASSFWLAAYSRWIWTPSMVPFFSLVSVLAFLKILKGNLRWWYILALSLGIGAQVHNSRYVSLIFYSTLFLWYRPPMLAKKYEKALTIALFILPFVPTILTEATNEFSMIRGLSKVVVYGIPTAIPFLPQSLTLFLIDAIGLRMTYIHFLLPFRALLIDHAAFLGVAFIMLFLGLLSSKMHRFIKENQWSTTHWFIIWRWVLFLPVLVLLEYLYADEGLNPYSRMNNLVFALPMFLVCISYVVIRIWNTRLFIWRLIVASGLIFFMAINMNLIYKFLWSYNESSWAYKDLHMLADSIPQVAQGLPYDLIIYRYEGAEKSFINTKVYEPLYFIDRENKEMPETFNNVTSWGANHIPLRGRQAKMLIIVIDPAYMSQVPLPKEAQYVGKKVGYFVYRVFK